jgi:hypothetical protein
MFDGSERAAIRLAREKSIAVYLPLRIIVLRAVGARLAREQSTGVYLPHRIIVLRGQASLLRANNPPRFTCHTASSFSAP